MRALVHALVLPGGGVAPPRSPLDVAVRVLDEHRYDVRRIWWTAPRTVRDPRSSGPADDWVRAQVERAVVGWDDPVLVVGKSLGTRAASYAAERGWPAIWLTPLLEAGSVVAGIAANPARQLLVGGLADRLWDGEVAAALRADGCDVREVPDADHALEVPGAEARNDAIRVELARAIEVFLGSLA